MKNAVKITISVIAAAATTAAMLPAAFAANDDVRIIIGGTELSIAENDTKPFIEDGRALVPMRALFEALGASVEWDGMTRTVTAASSNGSVELRVGSDTAKINGSEVRLDVPAKIVNDRTVVPLRVVSEGMNCKVDWSEETQTVTVSRTGNTLAEIKERGVLKVGTAGDYHPMSCLDPETGTYVGFDAELAEDLAKDIGVDLEYVKTSWPTLMDDTLNNRFDLAICGITVTDARKEKALMSDGYFKNGKTILIRAEDKDKYKTLEDINRPEVRVMENPGGLNEKFARENLPEATLMIHDKNEEIPSLIAAGEADVMITEIMEAGYYVGQDSRLAAPLIYEPFTSGQLGVLMPKGSEDLLEYVNGFLAREKESGRIEELGEKYIYKFIR